MFYLYLKDPLLGINLKMLWYLIILLRVVNFSQRIDHFDIRKRDSFNQTVIINEDYGNLSVSPVIFVIGDFEKLNGNPFPNGLLKIAKDTKSVILAVENRFFGSSKPNEGSIDDYFNYLTIDQSLYDISCIINTYFGSNGRKVLVVGSGVGGTLAAWFRLKYPHLSVASWSSSSPLLMTETFYQYDTQISKKITAISNDCFVETQKMLMEADPIVFFNVSPFRNWLLDQFGIRSSLKNTSIVYILAESLGIIEKFEQSKGTLSKYCQMLKKEGNFETLATILNMSLKYMNMEINNLDPYSAIGDERLKWYIQCTKIGLFHTYPPLGVPDSVRFRSMTIDSNFYRDVCIDLFGNYESFIDQTNLVFGSKEMKGNSMIFSYNLNDVFRPLGMQYSNVRNDVHVFFGNTTSKNFDLVVDENNEPENVKKTREIIWERAKGFLIDSCNSNCRHGKCVLGTCICHEGFEGMSCSDIVYSHKLINVLSMVGTLITTLIIIAVGLFLYKSLPPAFVSA